MKLGRRAALFAAALVMVKAAPHCLAQGGQSPSIRIQPGGRSIHVVLPNAGDYSVRILPSPDAKGAAQPPIIISGPEGDVHIDPVSAGKSPRLAIDDTKSGTTAIVALPKRDRLMLQPVQFDRIRSVEICVSRDGYAVKAAALTLEAGGEKRSVTIDAAMAGTARFDDVPIGRARISVRYGENSTEDRTTDLRAPAGGIPLRIVIAATNAVATVPVPAGGATPTPVATTTAGSPTGAPGPSPHPADRPSGGGATSVAGEMLGLIVACALLYGVYSLAKSGRLAEMLKKAGVEVQPAASGSDVGTPWNPNPAAPPVVADPSLCPYCGQKKDATGGCACTVGVGEPGAAAAPGVPSQPRLIGTAGVYAGAILPLPAAGGAASIGREPTNAIALPNDTTVSRRHASIQAAGGAFTLVDEGSSNGAFVNGVRVEGSRPLNPGDEVQIGNTRFRFEV